MLLMLGMIRTLENLQYVFSRSMTFQRTCPSGISLRLPFYAIFGCIKLLYADT
jgi:hypothetical protein